MPQPVDLAKKIILDPKVKHFADLNTDLGQSRDKAFFTQSHYELLNAVTSVNIPCAVHDGDPHYLLEMIRLAKYYNCSVGAHIGYPDPASSGYEKMDLDAEALSTWIYVQIGTLQALLKSEGLEIHYVRPHGALYTACFQNPDVAMTVAKALKKMSAWMVLVGPGGSALQKIESEIGLRTAPEFYLGKKYTADGLPNLDTGSLFLSPQAIISQVKQLLNHSTVSTEQGEPIKVDFKTIHISPKLPQCADVASRIHQLLIQPVSLPLADIGASGWL